MWSGLAVLADGAVLEGSLPQRPSAGYLLGFVPADALAGLGHGRPFRWALLAGLVAHGAVLGIGVPVLASHVGSSVAWDGLDPSARGRSVVGDGHRGS